MTEQEAIDILIHWIEWEKENSYNINHSEELIEMHENILNIVYKLDKIKKVLKESDIKIRDNIEVLENRDGASKLKVEMAIYNLINEYVSLKKMLGEID